MPLNLSKLFRKSDSIEMRDALARWTEAAAPAEPPQRVSTLVDPTRLKSVDDIAQRALIVSGITHAGFGCPRERVSSWLRDEGLWGGTTHWERELLTRAEAWPSELNRASWQVERLWMLAWALGLTGRLNHETPCGPNLGTLVPGPGSSTSRFRSGARRRDDLEIVMAHQTLESLIGRVDARAGREERMAGIVVERHQAMAWITGSATWDQ